MKKHAYLDWLANETPTKWDNDSAIIEEIQSALACGASGCTSNPPLSYLSLMHSPNTFGAQVRQIKSNCAGDEKAVELMSLVVRHISIMLKQLHQESGGKYGFIRSQVQPSLYDDVDAMLTMGKTIASWGENVKVKIPGTKAGVTVLEELAAMGIPTNPTVCVSVSQVLAVAEAHERGVKRALGAGIEPTDSTSAFVMGRLQDYLVTLNDKLDSPLAVSDLEWAMIAATKRCYRLISERGYRQILMPAAFRCTEQVKQLAGARVEMTIHPSIQELLIQEEANGGIPRRLCIDDAVDEKALDRVRKALPEFERAYDPDGMSPEEFTVFGATQMTLDSFDVTGWQKLVTF